MQYAYLLLYLQQRSPGDRTPLEKMVCEKLVTGSIDWLPDGRCIAAEGGDDVDELQEQLVKRPALQSYSLPVL